MGPAGFEGWFYTGPTPHFGFNKKTSPSPKGTHKGRKKGRNKDKCERYRKEGRLEANKLLRQARHEKHVKRAIRKRMARQQRALDAA